MEICLSFDHLTTSVLFSQAIFEALPYNTSLTSLDISSNQLTGVADDLVFDYDADVVETMAEGIAKNVTLKFLDISDNR